MADFPFSIQGVILAKITSPSRNAVKPFLTCENGRISGAVIAPSSASTAGMGTNVTGASAGSASLLGFGGFRSQRSGSPTAAHPSGKSESLMTCENCSGAIALILVQLIRPLTQTCSHFLAATTLDSVHRLPPRALRL